MGFNNNSSALSRSTYQERQRLSAGLTEITHGLELKPPYSVVVLAQDPISGVMIPLPWLLPTANTISVRQSLIELDVLITIIG